ncbi:MAG: phage tail protein [Pseudomonadota bacterium]
MTVAAGVQLAITVALQVGIGLLQNLLAPDRRGPRLNDRSVATADYGVPIALGYGAGVRLAGHVISRADLEVVERSEGGKGGPSVTTETYFWTGAVAFAAREATGLIRIIADGEVIFDAESDTGEDAKMPGLEFTFYRGTEDQEVDPILASQEGDLQPAYRGIVYVVFDRLPLENFGPRIPSIEAVIAFSTQPIANIANDVGTGDVPASLSSAGARFTYDRERNLIYYISSVGNDDFLSVADARTGQLVAQRPWLDIIEDQFGDTLPPRFGPASIAGASGPYLIVQTSGEGAGHLLTISKDTLTSVGAIGQVSNYRFTRAPADVNDEPVLLRASQMTTVTIPRGDGSFARFIVLGHSGLIFNTGAFANAILRILPGGRTEYVWGELVNLGGGLASVAVAEGIGTSVDLLLVSRRGNHSQPTGLSLWRVNLAADAFYDIPTDTVFGVQDPVLIWQTDRRSIGNVRTQYDSASGILSIFHDNIVVGIDVSDGREVWSRTDLNLVSNRFTQPVQDPLSGYVDGADVAVYTETEIILLDPATGQETGRQIYGTTNYTTNPQFPPGPSISIWDPVFSRLIHGRAGAVLYGERQSGGPEALPAVVADICARAGLSPDELDLTGLDAAETVEGYAIERTATGRGCLEPLGGVFNFDYGEAGDRLLFRHRGAAADYTISDDLLMPDDDGRRLVSERGAAIEAPLATSVVYSEAGFDHQDATQTFTRPSAPAGTAPSRGLATLSVPFVLEPDRAMALAERATIAADIGRRQIRGRASQRLLDAAVMDRVQITGPQGLDRVIRLEEVEKRGDYQVVFTGTEELASLYQPGAPGVPALERLLPRPLIDGPQGNGTVLPLDIPLLAETDRQGGENVGVVYAAAIRPAGAVSDYEPTQVFVLDPEGNAIRGPVVTEAMAWGILRVPPPDPPALEVNRYHRVSLEVEMVEGLTGIASLTEQAFLQGLGNEALILTGDGQAELIRYQIVTPVTGNVLQLSTFVRGRRGTDVFAYGHEAGAVMLFLDGERGLARLPIDASRIGRTLQASGGSDRIPTGAEVDGFPFRGNSLRAWRPWAVDRRDDGSMITITWRRVARQEGARPPSNAAPLLGDRDEFRVRIRATPGGEDLIDEDVTGASFTFDLGAIPAPATIIYVEIAQYGLAGLGLSREVELRS